MSFSTVKEGPWSYTFTSQDFDTACRAIWGEVSDSGSTWEADAHLYAMLNLSKTKGSLDAAFKNYSSPVNPAVELTERRRRIRSMPLTEIPAAVRNRVMAWMSGNPIKTAEGVDLTRIKDFSACAEAAALGRGASDLKGPSGQCYWFSGGTHHEYAFVGGSSNLLLYLGLAALLGGGLYYASKR